MTTVTARGVTFGEGLPKVIVPLTSPNADELVADAATVVAAGPDVVEWRVDLLTAATTDGPAAVLDAGLRLREALGDLPLLVTVRTSDEGGAATVTSEQYVDLYRGVLDAGVADLIDVEIFRDAEAVRTLIDLAHAASVPVVASNHDFDGTPPQTELESRLMTMAERGADILKIAVMPRTPGDVLELLGATWAVSQRTDQPLITMSMAGQGVVSRLAGGVFGSSATFGAVGRPSAPGQVAIEALRATLDVVHAH
ncbi:type I 3-dehydroquinate dehydratase [Cellulomonas chengniuliangii]|uniref:3-dehydroquinate dehydratase n=1 Tax=Cellulomonas chengniuliangii TaxID=2968084 RepID=A0ABY5L2G0_9CELL|nr:type I 3-dehydroquinate dehydratase [Cellulomonas chengniuliangii]MCC2308460.1 type I 3-dehydroquinate dehydratase [Cellulomonas chengniuliangii]UUI76834.1 type I 3-dehydroquinate dehydratase [Cellulomonas chengniuliangii]